MKFLKNVLQFVEFREQVKQDLEGEEVGTGERRNCELWNEKFTREFISANG